MELTRRELEVAGLVAEGLTNRTIAERLFLSERTVEGHVEHALNKLGMDSRTQLAAWAARSGAASARDVALPAPRTRFVGRAAEVALVGELVGRHRLVTLVGPGGVGKTRLALAVAGGLARFSRVRFADLAAVADAERVAAEVAAAVPARPDAATLVVVDNCEHVIEAAAQAVDALLRETPVHVLATCREALRVEGEAVARVEPLGDADAVELFLDRAVPGSSTAAGAAEVAARLDRLPLALELAAARTNVMTAEALAASLERSLDVLTTGPRAAPDRQRRLDASIEWSYRLLSGEDQAAFRALAVFEGTFNLDAAVAVAAAAPATLLGLAERSLLAASNEGRFRLLLPIREFARRELMAAGETEAAEGRHDAWVVELALRTRPGLVRNEGAAQLELWAERECVWPALDRLESRDPAGFVALALSFGYAGYQRLRADEVDRLMQRAVRVADPAHPDFALLQFGAAVGASAVRDAGRQVVHARLLLDLAEAGGDQVMAGRALNMLGFAARHERELREALALFERAASLIGEDEPGMTAAIQNNIAMTLYDLGEFERGERHARRALELAGQGSAGRAPSLDTLAHNVLGLGRVEEAEAIARESAELVLADRREGALPYVLAMLARLAAARGEEERAVTLLAAAARSHEDTRPLDTDAAWEEPRFRELSDRHPRAAARGREMDGWAALRWALGQG